uniref:EamA domain-containing protein n=1 Tax=Fundidesulfovibrio putealis TaxID=270496 RepID=A0A7C4AHB7_9BACT
MLRPAAVALLTAPTAAVRAVTSATPLQGAGVALVTAGTVAVGAASRDTATGRITWRGLGLAVLTALGTAGYSLADRKGMSLSPGPSAVEFLFLDYVALCALLTAYCAWKRPSVSGLFSQWRKNRRSVLLVSALMALSYVCVVAALGMGNVVLVTAGRNVGIPLSTLAGGLLLRERVTWGRAAGSLVIFGGLALLVLG